MHHAYRKANDAATPLENLSKTILRAAQEATVEALRHNTRTCKTEGNAISATLQENGITSESHITPVSEATAPSMNSHVYFQLVEDAFESWRQIRGGHQAQNFLVTLLLKERK